MEIVKETKPNEYKQIDLNELKTELKNIRYFEILHNELGFQNITEIVLTNENDLLIKVKEYFK